ncbi:MAG: AsmA family protein, partial [Polyangiales bacterium]
MITVVAILAVLAVGVALVPVLFRDQIIERLRSELNDRVDATVTFSDVDVSLLSTFPTLTAEVSGLAITGKGGFADVTLLKAKSIGAGIDVVGLVLRREITIESIEVNRPEVHLVVRADGKANYDIVPEQADGAEAPDGAIAFEIKRLRIDDGSLTYATPSVRVVVAGLAHDGRAKISGAVQELSLKTTVDELTARLGGIAYLKKAKASLDVDAIVDTDKKLLTLHALDVAVQQLALQGTGEIGWAGDGTALDLKLASEKGLPIKALISAIPNAYAADFKGLTASGTFSLAATIQGELGPGDEDIPSFSATANIQNGAFKYPDLPLGVTNLVLDASVKHPGGNLDRMRIDVPKYGFAAGKSQAKGRVTVTRPISQPRIDLSLDGRFDLAEISKAYPISDIEKMEGLVEATIALVAKGERIEKLSGNVEVSDLSYSPANGPAVRIRTAVIVLSPE